MQEYKGLRENVTDFWEYKGLHNTITFRFVGKQQDLSMFEKYNYNGTVGKQPFSGNAFVKIFWITKVCGITRQIQIQIPWEKYYNRFAVKYIHEVVFSPFEFKDNICHWKEQGRRHLISFHFFA